MDGVSTLPCPVRVLSRNPSKLARSSVPVEPTKSLEKTKDHATKGNSLPQSQGKEDRLAVVLVL